MIVTTIKIHGRSQKRKEILQTIKELVDQMVRDDGCESADLYRDLYDRDVFYIMEEWKTVSDLEKNKKSKSLAILFGLESLLVESLEIHYAVDCKILHEENED